MRRFILRVGPTAALFGCMLTACLVLLRHRLDWDEIAFLLRIRGPHPDHLHPLYPPLLRTWAGFLATAGIHPEVAGKILSAVCAALSATVLRTVLIKAGATRGPALIGALLFGTTEAALVAGTSVEVYAPAILGILLSWSCAQNHAASGHARWLLASIAFLFLAAGFHPAMLLGAVTLAFLARPARGFTLHKGPALAGAAAVTAIPLLWMVWTGDAMEELARYAKGFLPAEGLPATSDHAVEIGRYMVENEPVVGVLGGCGLAVLLWHDRKRLVGPVAFSAPFLLAYLAFGVPQIALFLPALLGLVLAMTLAASRAPRRWMGSLSLGAALITQLVLVLPARWDETSGEDTRVQHAQILDGLAPPDSVLVAGHLALHLRWVSNRDVIALGEEIHRRDGPPKPTRDPHRLIHDAIRPYADAKRPVYITFDGKRWLHDLAIQLHGSPEIAFNNLLPLIVPGAVIPHPGGDPKLLLQLLRPPP